MDEPSLEYKVIVGIILCTIALLTAIGNSLVIISIILVKSLQTPSNFLIVSLAVSDLLVSILVLPYSIYRQISISWGLGEYICYTYSIFDVLLCTSSILNLCAISIDRYRAITRPLQYAKRRTMKYMLLMIMIVWVMAFLISVPPIFIAPPTTDEGRCDLSENIWYQLYATFGAFYLPLFVMIILYIRIFKLARKMAQKDSELHKIARRASHLTTGDVSLSPNNPSNAGNNSNLYTKSEHRSHVKLLYSNIKEEARNIPITAPIKVRFPLPPSELCRRRCPRVICQLEHLTKNLPTVTQNSESQTNDRDRMDKTTNNAINSKHFKNKSEFTIPYVDQSIETLINSETERATQTVVRKPTDDSGNILKSQNKQQLSLPVSPVHQVNMVQPLQTSMTNSNSFYAKKELYHKAPLNTNHPIYKQKPSLNTSQAQKFQKVPTHNNNNNTSEMDLSDQKNSQYFLGRRQSSVITLNHQNAHNYLPTYGSNQLGNLQLDMSGQNSSHFSLNVIGKAPGNSKRNKEEQKRNSSETKAIKTLGVIMGCFCLCWIPFFIIAISKPIYKVIMKDQNLPISMHAESFFLWLGYMNSTFNPIIYALFNLEFRVPFKHLLTCRCQNLNARLRSERYANEFGSLVFS